MKAIEERADHRIDARRFVHALQIINVLEHPIFQRISRAAHIFFHRNRLRAPNAARRCTLLEAKTNRQNHRRDALAVRFAQHFDALCAANLPVESSPRGAHRRCRD